MSQDVLLAGMAAGRLMAIGPVPIFDLGLTDDLGANLLTDDAGINPLTAG